MEEPRLEDGALPQAEGVAGALRLKLKTYPERCSVCGQCFNSFEWEYLLPCGFSSLPQDQPFTMPSLQFA